MSFINLPVMYGHDVQVNEPGERVLVHRVNVGQICYGEKQDGRVFGDWSIPLPRLFNLPLGFLTNLFIQSIRMK